MESFDTPKANTVCVKSDAKPTALTSSGMANSGSCTIALKGFKGPSTHLAVVKRSPDLPQVIQVAVHLYTTGHIWTSALRLEYILTRKNSSASHLLGRRRLRFKEGSKRPRRSHLWPQTNPKPGNPPKPGLILVESTFSICQALLSLGTMGGLITICLVKHHSTFHLVFSLQIFK